MRKATSKMKLIRVIAIMMILFILQVETVDAAADSDAELKAVIAVLNQIETGRTALARMEQYGVEVRFKTGQGAYYRASDNRMVIDGSKGAQRAALSFVHEMTHAHYHNEGQRVEIGEVDKELYVQGRIEEEAEGVVRSIEAKKELSRAGFDVSQVQYPLEKAYTKAYLMAQNIARARERDITSAELDSIGRVAGMARVIQGHLNGEVLGSRSLSTYTETYGDCWQVADSLSSLALVVGKAFSIEAAMYLMQSANDYVSGTC